jgi:pimeloyl-ACP methyl ester carboxylesterase
MPTAIINGLPLTYADSGGEGPVIVLGHGFFLDHTIFSAQTAALGHRWRVVSWDARGHGGTPDADTAYTYWDQARDVLGLLDHLRIEQATIGGVSQGGFIALRTALLAPDRVSGLILSDTEATACHPEDKVAYGTMFDALAELGPVEEITRPLSAQLLGECAAADEWRERWRHRPLPLGAAATCLFDRDDISGHLSQIGCPALLIWGELDRSLPRDRMDLLRDRLAGATPVHVIARAAHTPPVTHPDQVNAILQEFLTP